MAELNMTKVGVRCPDIETLEGYVQRRLEADGECGIFTRFLPKRAEEMIGGSVYWIIRSRLACRQRILGFGDGVDWQGRARVKILLDPAVVRVVPLHFRPHQGWRYLEAADAPADLDGIGGGAELPPEMLADLAKLDLI